MKPLFRPVVYLSGPITKGDPAINTRSACLLFDQLIRERLVLPVVPHWSHFQHVMYPLPYTTWLEYDLAMIPRYDACLRFTAAYHAPGLHYTQVASRGADREVARFSELGKPVFFSVRDLYSWVHAVNGAGADVDPRETVFPEAPWPKPT